MRKHKLIGVICSNLNEIYQSNVISGVLEGCREYGYNTAVFSSFSSFFMSENAYSLKNEIGESDIFNLINAERFDGLIFLPNTLWCKETRTKVAEKLAKVAKTIPCVFIDKEVEPFMSVNADDYTPFYQMTEHFIKVHKKKHIRMLSGPVENPASVIREKAFRDAIVANGLEFDDSLIYNGDFWKYEPIEYGKRILSGEIPMPEAVVCGNDVMAETLCDFLILNGYKVPEDIAISGYDHFEEMRLHHPQVSSVSAPLTQIGRKCSELIYEYYNGGNKERHVLIPGEFIPSETCGCPGTEERISDTKLFQDNDQIASQLTSSHYMFEDLLQSDSLEDCLKKLYTYLYLIDGIKDLYICLTDDWNTLHDEQFDYRPSDEYPPTMNVAYAVENSVGKEVPYRIRTADMIPVLFEETENPITMFFTPMNFMNYRFGYAVMSYGENNSTALFDYRYCYWIRNVCNALEHIRVQTHLRWAMSRLENISVVDMLTGVFNRRGYENRVAQLFDKACREKKSFLVLMGDLDCLKKINDNYGHSEGDCAIKVIAKAFQSTYSGTEVCARLGGDEFILVDVGDFDESTINDYEQSINNYIKQYNKLSQKPYEVSTSLGGCCEVPIKENGYWSYVNRADMTMYENKKRKKK